MTEQQDPESPYAWMRLCVSLALMTIGGAGMYTVTVVLPRVQAEFDVGRSGASMPYTLTMIGFALGGVLMGKLSDRHGVMVPVIAGALCLGTGLIVAGSATHLWQFGLIQGVLIGLLGTSATFAPLVADTSLWFTRRRGIAVAICSSGNNLAGVIWPPVMQYFIDRDGWRQTYMAAGVFCILAMLPLALVLRRRPRIPLQVAFGRTASPAQAETGTGQPLGFSPSTLQVLLSIAGVSCCVAMSMPHVHIVAYCGDLGYGPAHGAQMLSLILAFGIVSRLASGWISDHIGGLRTLLLGSLLQCIALLLFLPFNGLASLYVISALFGLFQGGIVPSYALIVREYFTPREAGARIGAVLMATLFGMALGGWMSGAIFDLTRSYRAAFLNGIVWNLVNLSIVLMLLYRTHTHAAVTR